MKRLLGQIGLLLLLVAPVWAQRTSVPVSNTTPVQIFDSSGNAVDSFTVTSGAETAAGTAATLTDVLLRAGCVRDDATTTLDSAHADADWTPFRCNARGAAWVALDTALSHTIDSIGIGDGTNLALVDPCKSEAKTTTPISQAADTNVITKHATKITYICFVHIMAGASAEIVSIIQGDGTTCSTNRVALSGSVTDSEGNALAANGGFVNGTGESTVLRATLANRDICVNLSATNRVTGAITWVQR